MSRTRHVRQEPHHRELKGTGAADLMERWLVTLWLVAREGLSTELEINALCKIELTVECEVDLPSSEGAHDVGRPFPQLHYLSLRLASQNRLAR